LQAAIHLACYNRKVILIVQGGGSTSHALHIENYLGFEVISGKELIDSGIKQIKPFVAEFEHEQVISVRAGIGFIVSANITQYRAQRCSVFLLSVHKKIRLFSPVTGDTEMFPAF
jgi:thioredoxin reductase (NADPH)